MQRFSDNLPRIAEVANLVSGRTYVTFHTQPGVSLLLAGVKIEPSTILRDGTMPLPSEDLSSIGEVMSGID